MGTLALATVGVVGGLVKRQRREFAAADPAPPPNAEETVATLLAFLAALFGREFTSEDGAELTGRLELLLSDALLASNCAVLVRVLAESARSVGASAFELCSSYQQDSIINKIMNVDEKSRFSLIWARWSINEHDRFRMRRSAIPQLAWLYRHSGVAWRERGYSRSAGMAGDWREALVPGAPYP